MRRITLTAVPLIALLVGVTPSANAQAPSGDTASESSEELADWPVPAPPRPGPPPPVSGPYSVEYYAGGYHIVPVDAEAEAERSTRGRGLKISGAILACLGGTAVIGGLVGMGSAGLTGKDGTGGAVVVIAGGATTLLGIALLIAGAVRRHSTPAPSSVAVLPAVSPAADGEGIVLGATGTF